MPRIARSTIRNYSTPHITWSTIKKYSYTPYYREYNQELFLHPILHGVQLFLHPILHGVQSGIILTPHTTRSTIRNYSYTPYFTEYHQELFLHPILHGVQSGIILTPHITRSTIRNYSYTPYCTESLQNMLLNFQSFLKKGVYKFYFTFSIIPDLVCSCMDN